MDTFAPGILFSFGFSKYLPQNELCIHFTINLVAFAKDQPLYSRQEFNICEFLAVWVIVSENPLHLACVCSSPHPQSEKKKYIIWPLDKILLKQIFVGG